MLCLSQLLSIAVVIMPTILSHETLSCQTAVFQSTCRWSFQITLVTCAPSLRSVVVAIFHPLISCVDLDDHVGINATMWLDFRLLPEYKFNDTYATNLYHQLVPSTPVFASTNLNNL